MQLDSLTKSIDALDRSVKTASSLDTSDDDLRETVRAGVIQNFEVAYEQCWKMMKRWLEENIGRTYVDGVTRRELFRLGGGKSPHHRCRTVDGLSHRNATRPPTLTMKQLPKACLRKQLGLHMMPDSF